MAKLETVEAIVKAAALPVDTNLEFVKTQSRWVGTGYKDSIYRIAGSDDAIIVHHNLGGGQCDFYDEAVVSTGYFSERRQYAKECGRLSKKYGIPFEVCLAIGTNEEVYPRVAELAKYPVGEELSWELNCGIGRRKSALNWILGDQLYEQLGVESMGQANSQRLAAYFDNHVEE